MHNVNISAVAELAGVSPTTVSRVLNNSSLVKPATLENVKLAMDKLNYRPSAVARSLRMKETKTIGVIVSNIMNPFFTSIVRGIEDVANKSNYHIMLCNTDEQPTKEIDYISDLMGKYVDGLIIASTGAEINYSQILGNTPTVFLDRKPVGGDSDKFDIVTVDNYMGSYEAVKQLAAQKYKRIGIIADISISTTGTQRLVGYRMALEDAGIQFERELVKNGDFLGKNSFDLTIELVEQAECDAIFTANNMILMQVLKALRHLNLNVPNDVGVVTFDDLDWMKFCEPQITAVWQPVYDMGVSAMNLLMERISDSSESPRTVMFPVELNVRGSSTKTK